MKLQRVVVAEVCEEEEVAMGSNAEDQKRSNIGGSVFVCFGISIFSGEWTVSFTQEVVNLILNKNKKSI